MKTRNTCEDRKVFILYLQLRRHGYCVTIIQIGTKESPVPRFCLIWNKLSPSSSIASPSRRFSFIATPIRIIWGTKGIRCALGAPVPGIYHLWMVNRQHQGTPLAGINTQKPRKELALVVLGLIYYQMTISEIILRLLVFPHVYTKLYILIKFRAM